MPQDDLGSDCCRSRYISRPLLGIFPVVVLRVSDKRRVGKIQQLNPFSPPWVLSLASCPGESARTSLWRPRLTHTIQSRNSASVPDFLPLARGICGYRDSYQSRHRTRCVRVWLYVSVAETLQDACAQREDDTGQSAPQY